MRPVVISLAFLLVIIVLTLPAAESGWRRRFRQAVAWRRRRRRCSRVNCRWGNWGGWSSCSTPCGNGGTSTRTRGVAVNPTCGGSGCSGPNYEKKSCNRFCKNGGIPLSNSCDCRKTSYYGTCCEKTCVTGDWGEWGSCSATCSKQKGTSFRSRGVYNAEQCYLIQKEEKTCLYMDGNKCGVHGLPSREGKCECDYGYHGDCCEKSCILGVWSVWGACSANCSEQNGKTVRSRNVSDIESCRPLGVEERRCVYLDGQTCGDHGFAGRGDTCRCNYEYYGDCCEKACVHGTWGEWGACSATCSEQNGRMFRSRDVDDVPECHFLRRAERRCVYMDGKKCGAHGTPDRIGQCKCDDGYEGDCCEKGNDDDGEDDDGDDDDDGDGDGDDDDDE